jgi:solute carrier family 25 protein 44
VGFIPAQLAYNFIYEFTRAHLPAQVARKDDQVTRNFYGGAAASFASSIVNVPLDVVTQRIMVQPAGRRKYLGWRGLSVVWREEGLRGLYRGFGLSVMSYVPASAIWWSTYTAVNTRAMSALQPDPRLAWLVTGVCGAVAGFTSAALTNPLDVVKTRLQVLDADEWGAARRGSRVVAVVKALVAEEGLRGFSKGLTARLASSSIVSLFIITTYEGVKRLSREHRQQQPQRQFHSVPSPSTSAITEQLAT